MHGVDDRRSRRCPAWSGSPGCHDVQVFDVIIALGNDEALQPGGGVELASVLGREVHGSKHVGLDLVYRGGELGQLGPGLVGDTVPLHLALAMKAETTRRPLLPACARGLRRDCGGWRGKSSVIAARPLPRHGATESGTRSRLAPTSYTTRRDTTRHGRRCGGPRPKQSTVYPRKQRAPLMPR